MPLDSNRPLQRVHNGGDGIWDGAGWGVVAGAGATTVAYGTAVHGAKHLANLNAMMTGRAQARMIARNNKAIEKNKKHYSEAAMQERLTKVAKRSDRFISAMDKVGETGHFAFGSAKRAASTVATGLLGGMIAGAVIDSIE
jgi:hypothetical protein